MVSQLRQLEQIVQQGPLDTKEALRFFDQLGPVTLEFMAGRWQGTELPTGHPLSGLLANLHWYGKEFIDGEQVHPLLFTGRNQQIFRVKPNQIALDLGLRLPFLQSPALIPMLRILIALSKTEASQARLRLMEYRGQVSATMVYDYLPIQDTFRKVDEVSVLGLMDLKGDSQPFFFLLTRESSSEL